LVRVREVEQLGPVLFRELAPSWDGHAAGLDRSVAGEDAAAQEVGRRFVDRVLEVAVQVARGDALGKGERQAVDRAHLDYALEQAPRHEAQGDRVNDAEKTVAADRQAEELRVLAAAAIKKPPARVEQLDRLDIADDRRQRQAAPVRIGGERTAEG